MPRTIGSGERMYAIQLMQQKNDDGTFRYTQYDIHYETGLSRPFLRKLATEIGHQFPRNGIELKGKLCMCTCCGNMFRKPPSRAKRAKNQFCDETCRVIWSRGENHPSWDKGQSVNTFSQWVKSQKGYKDFVTGVLSRDNYTCVISGRKDNLEAHHIFQKAEGFNPELAFDISNGITVNKDVHDRIHKLIREGKDFEEAIELTRSEYAEQSK